MISEPGPAVARGMIRWIGALAFSMPAIATLTVQSAAQDTLYMTAYGPMTRCIGGYAVAVEATEGAVVVDVADGTRIRGGAFTEFTAVTEIAGTDGRKVRISAVEAPGVGTVVRHWYPTQDDNRPGIPGEVVFFRAPAHAEYVLPATAGGSAVRVTSPGFDGDAGDLALFARFGPRSASTPCYVLSGDRESAEAREAAQWSPVRTDGPGWVCAGALAIELRKGEFAQHTWVNSPGLSYWRISGAGYRVSVIGGRVTGLRNRPNGKLRSLGYDIEQGFAPGQWTLRPPASYPADHNDNGRVFLHATGLDEASLIEFFDRLEYVSRRDRRCEARNQ